MSIQAPPYYTGLGGNLQVQDIAGHLTGNAAQVVQYVVRASRLDGRNKAKDLAGRIEDLKKARIFLDFEVARLEGRVATDVTVQDGRIAKASAQ